ncbi:MAG: methyltransferase domain-containing protein [Sphingomonadales bacterium]|nr:methyltransferase domain-containing protein [Sphingomonadales bacterium]MDE2569400.1 methyltransferase domain-containing protein [Sphingomonadales bacterium]
MTTNSDWEGSVGHAWATEWHRTDRSFAGLTRELLARVAVLAGREVLDIGCGAGEVSLALADMWSQAHVTGLDLSHELLDEARGRAGDRANLAFVHADASAWHPAAAPDLLVSRHGVMFFDDPHAAFAHIAEFAAPSASLVFSCFRSPGENAWASEVANAVMPGSPQGSPQGYAPGPFGFADRDFTAAMLAASGWRDVSIEPVDYDYVAGEGAAAIEDALAFLRRIGPAARALRELPGEAREAAGARLRAVLADRLDEGVIAWPAAAWIVSARKA